MEDFTKLVCIKREFVDRYAETPDVYSKRPKSLIQPHTMIWNTNKLSGCNVHAQLWTQPPFSNEVDSPFFVCSKLERPDNVYTRLNMTAAPCRTTPTSSPCSMGAQSKRRFFIFTSERQLHCFETDECRVLKGTVGLATMKERCHALQAHSEKFEIPCVARKWLFTCSTSQESIALCNAINRVRADSKAVVNRIIAAQIQGQPHDDTETAELQHASSRRSDQKQQLLFEAPLGEQVVRLLLKGDHASIRVSVLDEMLRSDAKPTASPKLRKKRGGSSRARSLSKQQTH